MISATKFYDKISYDGLSCTMDVGIGRYIVECANMEVMILLLENFQSVERARISAGRLDEIMLGLLRWLADANCVSKVAAGAKVSHGQISTSAGRAHESS